MRLLIVNPFAGAPTRQVPYALLAEQTGWQVDLLVARRWVDDFGVTVAAERHPRFVGELYPVSVFLSGHIPLHMYRQSVRSILRTGGADLVYVYHEPYGVATYQVLRANRAEGRTPVGFYSSQNIRKHYRLPFRRMEQKVFAWADFAIAVSDTVSSVLRAKGFEGPLEVVPFGVDTSVFAPGESPRDLSGAVVAGYIGRLVPEKGVETMLRALARVSDPRLRGLVVVTDLIGTA